MTEENEEYESEDNYNKNFEGKKDENFEYPENYQEKFIKDIDLPNSLSKPYELLGLDVSKRYNYYFLNNDEIIMSIANTFQIFNLTTKERKIFFATETGGIGAVTAHPDKKFFAVGECGNFPNIYIFRYEEGKAKLYRILRKGTEQVYSALSFNDKGDLLASVGGEPDYNLVIWNWKTEAIILKAKAFSQEVFRVQFSSLFEEKSITSGMGHIKFWEMATTFTGLKLQGELGKFGQVDLSDISAFVEFPDGKVLSGSEHGTFLLWEGIFIKANLDEGEKQKIHENGLVEHMSWIKNDDPEQIKIMSAGHDGKIKWWKYLDIENVQLDDFSNGVIKPIRTVQLINPVNNRPIKIMNLVKNDNFWLVQDGNGFLVKVIPSETDDNFQCEVIFECHAGKVLLSAFENKMPLLVSIGEDEKISLSTYHSNLKEFPERLIIEEPFSHKSIKPTCAEIPKRELNDTPYVISIGYSNGLFKIFSLNPSQKKVGLIFQARPHTSPIQILKFSPDESYFLTATKEEVFFFIVQQMDKLIPWCSIHFEDAKIVDIDWNPDSKRILVGFSNGTLKEIEIPLHFDNSNSYINTGYTFKEMKVKKAETEIEKIDEKKRQRQKEQGKLKEDPEPGSIYSCKYIGLYNEDDFIVTSQKPYNESLHLCNLNFLETNPDHRPINAWKLPPGDFIIKHISTNFIFLVEHHGTLQIRHRKLMDKYVEILPNLPGVPISSISTSEDEKFISICYEDGFNAIYGIDTDGINMHIEMYTSGNLDEEQAAALQKREFPEIQLEKKKVDECLAMLKQGEFTVIEEDIDIENILSLEDEKQQAQEKEREKIANEKKEKLFIKVKKLRDDFQKLVDMNNKLPEEVRLTPDELIIDNNYLGVVQEEQKVLLDDVEAKYNWLKANVEITINKINTFFLSSVHTGKTVVYSFRTNEKVQTIRCPNLPDNFDERVKTFESEIADFERKTDFDSLASSYQDLIGSNTIDQKKELELIDSLIEKGQVRINSQMEKKEGGQAIIEPEIESTKPDIADIEEFLNARRKFVGKTTKGGSKIVDYGSSSKNIAGKKGVKVEKVEEVIRCPDEYNLKMKYTKRYNEKNMLINSKHLRRIYYFLKLLFDERERFNKKVLDLKEMKITIMNQLVEYKKIIEGYNEILKVKEDYDWFHFENKDFTEDLMKIDEKILNEYMEKKIAKDPELKQIYEEEKKEAEESKKKNPEDDDDDEWVFEVQTRHNKQTYSTEMESEKKILDEMKYNHLKSEKLKQIDEEINDFDKRVERLKNERVLCAYLQKLGEYELLIKQKELNKIRAYESEDKQLTQSLFKLFEQYEINLSNLNNNKAALKTILDDKKAAEAKIKEYDEEFKKLIENEGVNKEAYEKYYNLCSREPQKDANGEDKMEEEDINLPKSMANKSLKEEIKQKAESKKMTLSEIEKYENKIKENEKKKTADLTQKRGLDSNKDKIIDKINVNENHKAKYMNQIELAFPVLISQFENIDNRGITRETLSDTIFININKIRDLERSLLDVTKQNEKYTQEKDSYGTFHLQKINEQKRLRKECEDFDNEFKNEQILKFGLEIKFDKLLQASKKTTVDKFESEYRKLKIESNRQIESMKNKIDKAKAVLNEQTVANTKELEKIQENLYLKQQNDQKLEAKNSEITKKNNKKYALVDLKKKKDRLKEIMSLLKHQMDALKKEIDIFKKKGGHIYSTIASNLV